MNALVQSIRGLGSFRIVILTLIGSVLLGVFAFMSFKLASPVMAPLYSNLPTDDAGAVVAELGAMGVPFEVTANGSTILTPSSDVLGIRMALAQKGLPSKGSIVGYEVFDKSDSLGTSSFVHNVNLIRALEGELGRTISSLGLIKNARVHLVIPKREIFARDKIEPSASIVITLNNQTGLTREQIFSIQHLVATAVPGLKLSRITIVDSTGRLLAKGMDEQGSESAEGGGTTAGMATEAQEFRESVEKGLKSTLEDLLSKTLGMGKVKAEVSAEIGFDRVTSSSERFDPDGQVARSIQSTTASEKSGAGAGGDVSAANNLPGASAAGAGGASGSAIDKVDEITNFEISKTVTSTVSEVGTIKRVSVAVLVDGKYEKDAEGNRTYVPRTEEELEQIRVLARTAVGFNEGRGDSLEVINMRFSEQDDTLLPEEDALDWLKQDLDSILKTVVIGVVAILTIMLVIRPLVNRAFEVSPAELEAQNAAQAGGGISAPAGYENYTEAAASGIDLDQIQSRMEETSTKKVNELVQNNPEETLTVIRGWLANKG